MGARAALARSARARTACVGTAIAALTAGLVGVGATATPAQAAGAPLKIALISSLTGPGGPEFTNAQVGFLARIDLQNAEGGVDGHKITPMVINDQTSLTDVVTGVQDALSDDVIGIVSDSPVFFAAAKYPQQAGVPVTGGYFDGPEWGEQPYTNMFSSDAGSVDPEYPENTGVALFIKDHGGTVLGSYGYSISPSSTREAIGTAGAFKYEGEKVGALDTSVPFGGVDFTTEALVAKSDHVNAVWATMDDNSNFALATAFAQAGVKTKAVVFPTGYEPSVVGSTVWKTLQGDYFISEFRPFSLPDNGTRTMQKALEKYEHFGASEFPSYGQYESWLGADLMIEGIERAGSNPTHASVIKALRNITSYNGGGLLPETIDYKTIFGHDLPKGCDWYLKAEPKGFVPVSSTPFCGKDIPGTSTVSGS